MQWESGTKEIRVAERVGWKESRHESLDGKEEQGAERRREFVDTDGLESQKGQVGDAEVVINQETREDAVCGEDQTEWP